MCIGVVYWCAGALDRSIIIHFVANKKKGERRGTILLPAIQENIQNVSKVLFRHIMSSDAGTHLYAAFQLD